MAALRAYLKQAATQQGYRERWLATRKVNQRARQFYEINGYARISYYGPCRDRE